MSPKPSKVAIGSWWLYDLANTIFSMGIESLFFALWIREQVGPERADKIFGLLTSIGFGLIFILAPILGAFSDRSRLRMPYLFVTTLICVSATALLGRFSFEATALLYILALAAYNAGLQFYDSLLASVSTPSNRGRIGGIGVGLGYLGALIAVGYGFFFPEAEKPFLFLLIAVTFFLLALPCFVFVKERENPEPKPIRPSVLPEVVGKIWRTLKDTKRYPGLLRFLVARAFYTDAINTIIAVMGLFCINVVMEAGWSQAMGEREVYRVMTMAILFAVPGGFFWGWWVDRTTPRRTLLWVLRLWLVTLLLASAIGFFGLPVFMLYIVGILAGLGLGGVWSADRPLMLQMAPPERIGEFFGLYGMVGRFSALTGPAIWALCSYVGIKHFAMTPLKAQGLSVLVLFMFVLVSVILIRKLPANS